MEITDKIVSASLNDVAHMVFPSFISLESQKQKMQRRMGKPKEISIQKTVVLLEGSITVFHTSKMERNWTNSLLEKS
jgi:hypothetical protein